MASQRVRLAARAVIVEQNRLLLVNAWPDDRSPLLCAPGGGAERGTSLPDNLIREVHEETGLIARVGAPCLINEFHDPKTGFHQVEVFFRCSVDGEPDIDQNWQDPERIVTRHVWASETEMAELMVKPDSLAGVAFSADTDIRYDALERIVM